MPFEVPPPRVINTSECRISYRAIGQGPAVLRLRGGGPGATVVFRNTGHRVQVERSAEFVQYVSAFLTR